jgi:acetyltransferase-like isoleucine patch superfamily enzyme
MIDKLLRVSPATSLRSTRRVTTRRWFPPSVVAANSARIRIARTARIRTDKKSMLSIGFMPPAGRAVNLDLGHGAELVVGGRVAIAAGCWINVFPSATLTIGDRTYLNFNTTVIASERIEIGAECAIAWNVSIIDTDFHFLSPDDEKPLAAKDPVKIGDRVWIGTGSTVLKGVRIGDGAVVAAHAVVSRDVPPKCLVAGSPARVIKRDVRWQ